jgi:hypothetical protein
MKALIFVISLALQAELAFGAAKTGVASTANSIVGTNRTIRSLLTLVLFLLVGKQNE